MEFCAMCNGTGEIAEGVRCMFCLGLGELPEPAAFEAPEAPEMTEEDEP